MAQKVSTDPEDLADSHNEQYAGHQAMTDYSTVYETGDFGEMRVLVYCLQCSYEEWGKIHNQLGGK